MITIHNDADNRPGGRSFFRDDEFLDYEEQNHVFDAVIAEQVRTFSTSTARAPSSSTADM